MSQRPPKSQRQAAPHRKVEGWRSSKGRRLTGWANTKARKELFHAEPLCRECLKHDRATAAAIRDHIEPLAFGGQEHPTNVQPLCRRCHDEKSKAEAAEGARRRRGGGFKV